jgi:hypothetical protein
MLRNLAKDGKGGIPLPTRQLIGAVGIPDLDRFGRAVAAPVVIGGGSVLAVHGAQFGCIPLQLFAQIGQEFFVNMAAKDRQQFHPALSIGPGQPPLDNTLQIRLQRRPTRTGRRATKDGQPL